MNKRYFSIQEIVQITGINASKLRYAEKQKDGLLINKIRNRRYYSLKDIEQLLSYGNFKLSIEEFKSRLTNPKLTSPKLTSAKPTNNNFIFAAQSLKQRMLDVGSPQKCEDHYQNHSTHQNHLNISIVQDIDILIAKFRNIAKKLEASKI